MDTMQAAERVVKMASIDVFETVDRILNTIGKKPFLQKKKTDEEKLAEYQELRSTPYSMLDRAEGIRQTIEARLAGIEPAQREEWGVGEDVIREYGYAKTLQYVAEMLALSDKLGIPVVGSEALPPPPPEPPMMVGGDPWQTQMPGGDQFPDMEMAAQAPAEPLGPPPPESLPPLNF